MSSPYERRAGQQRLIDFAKVKDTLTKNALIWVAPTVAFFVVGTLHALTKKDEWKASQALVVRDEAIGEMGFGGSSTPLGRFDSNDTLKRSLETILQIAKNRLVAEFALSKVGPVGNADEEYPSDRDIESLLGEISVSAPKGTEFGSSEVIYLSVNATKPMRAVNLTDAVCEELERRMKELRNDHAKSIISELTEKKNLAERELDAATVELSFLEQELGADLGEMRTLAEAGSAGESNIRTQLNQIKVELRQEESRQETQIALAALLRQVGNDADSILAAPNQLLEAQPSLRQLKDGMVEAQLRTARLRGSLMETHPRIRVSMQNEQSVKQELLREAQNAVRAAESDIQVSAGRIAMTNKKLEDVQHRLDLLAGQRAGYVNMTSKVSQRREQLRQSSVSLAEARGRLEAARTSSLITRLDDPVTGSSPNGPGRLVLIAGSTIGGLLLGLSLVYLVAPWQEIARAGRRKTDQLGRRSSDENVDSNDRRAIAQQVPQLTDARPLQFQTLSEAVQSLPAANSETDVTSSLDHLTRILEEN